MLRFLGLVSNPSCSELANKEYFYKKSLMFPRIIMLHYVYTPLIHISIRSHRPYKAIGSVEVCKQLWGCRATTQAILHGSWLKAESRHKFCTHLFCPRPAECGCLLLPEDRGVFSILLLYTLYSGHCLCFLIFQLRIFLV